MTESSVIAGGAVVIDLRDRKNPPADDPVNAPYGYRWDTRRREWTVKRSAGGRKSGAAWFGQKSDEIEDRVAEVLEERGFTDPEPAHMSTPARKAPKSQSPPVRVSAKVKGDITGAVGLIGAFVLPPAAARDPYCGGALADNFEKIADALVPLLCKSETVVGFFSDTGNDWMLWVKLAMAMTPVVMAVGQHHILKTVEIRQDRETGDLFAVPKDMSEYVTEPEVPDDVLP